MTEMPSHHKIAIASIKCFTDDGKLDLNELNFLIGIALADNIITDDEKRILQNVFAKVGPGIGGPNVTERIRSIKTLHGI